MGHGSDAGRNAALVHQRRSTACETVAATLQRELRTTHREPTLDLARRELHSREHGGERWLHFQAAHEGEGADAEGGERVRDHAAHARL